MESMKLQLINFKIPVNSDMENKYCKVVHALKLFFLYLEKRSKI